MASLHLRRFLHVVCVILTVITSCLTTSAHRRFEYKFSFKGPHLVQRDGTVPFWEHGGHAIASDESIRITPSLRSKKGHVWSKNVATFEHWEIEVVFRVTGRGRVGADGLAVWYTQEKGQDGPVFGSSDQWNGMGLFFDSFDNDGQHNNPYVMVILNDGTQHYNHQLDGMNQQLGGCLRDFRNKPFPVRVKVEYFLNTLTVSFHSGMTNNREDYELCLRAENVHLPKQGYFGVSAATGGLADDHDVSAFLTHSLTPQDAAETPPPQVSEDEKKRFEEEFDEYWQKLQKAKEEYQKEHPGQKPPDMDDREYFETEEQKELKMIFDGQNAIQQNIRSLHKKMDEIIGRQERTLSQLSLMSGQPPVQGQGSAPAQLPQIDTIKRHEVDTLMRQQRDVNSQIQDVQNKVRDIHSRSGSVQAAGSGFDMNQFKNNLNSIQDDIKTMLQKPQGSVSCPNVDLPNCITPLYFFIFMSIQLAIIIGYAMFRSSKEAAAKKFY